MNYKQAVLRIAAEKQITISGIENGEVNLMAPNGYWFPDHEIHESINSPNWSQSLSDMWKQAYREIKTMRVEKHNDPNCEWCQS